MTSRGRNTGNTGKGHWAMIKYMIHAVPKRMWYVTDFLIPSMKAQGIKESEIHVWLDDKKWGNLKSFFRSMEWVRDNCDNDSGIWHLQDDVLISSDFKERTDLIGGCAYGFCNDFFNPVTKDFVGFVPIEQAWSSFQCVRIPNSYAGEFIEWYRQNKHHMIVWGLANRNECDDTLFNFFLQDWHREDPITNIAPNLVEHVDFLIGGTTLSNYNGMTLSYYWGEDNLVFSLANAIRADKNHQYREAKTRMREERYGRLK